MLKITHVSAAEDPIAKLRVEGRLVERNVTELDHACERALQHARFVLLDLSGVSFVDAEGARAVTKLAEGHVTPVGCTPFVSAILRAGVDEDPEAADTSALVMRLRRRDPDAVEEMLRRHGGRLLTSARRLLHDEDDAQRAVQEGVLSALTDLEDPSANVQLPVWLHRFVLGAAVMRLRTRHRAAEECLDALLPTFDASGHWAEPVAPLPLAEARETAVIAERCIDRLPESFRTIFVLCDVESLGIAEVAALLGTTGAAVKGRLHRARQALRTLLVRALGDRPSALRAI